MRSARTLAPCVFVLALLAGCNVIDDLGARGAATEPVLPTPGPEATLVFDYLSTLETLDRGTPAEQAEIAERARRAASLEPTTANRLRYALVLGLPGHGATDAASARTELGVLLATPERMLPAEVALATVMLRDVNTRLALESENQRLSNQAGRTERDQVQALTRRLQAQASENARLKQQLDEALAKLEAVAALERSLAERQNGPRTP